MTMVVPMPPRRAPGAPGAPGAFDANGRNWIVVTAIALFLMFFAFDIEVPVGQFASVSIWVLAATPLLVWSSNRRGNLGRVIFFAAALGAFLAAHQFLASRYTYGVPLTRALTVGPIFAVCAGLLFSVAINSSERLFAALVLSIKIFLVVQPLMQFIELVFGIDFVAINQFQHYFLPFRRVSGLFYEPSHLGVALAIPIVFAIVYPKIWLAKFGLIFTGLLGLIVLLTPSATVIAVIAIAFGLLGLRSGRNAAIVSVLSGVIAVGGTTWVLDNRTSDPIAIRVYETITAISNDSNTVNRSSMVLAKGLYIARRVLAEKPLGFGFDNASYANEDYGFEYGGRDWRENDKDLVSTYSKVTAEMGWVGLFALILGGIQLARTALRRKTHPIGIISMIALGILLANIVRGGGYFSQGVIFTLAWCWVLVFERRVAAPRSQQAVRPPGAFAVAPPRPGVPPRPEP